MVKGDKEVLLDVDYGSEAPTTDTYGSLHNGGIIPPRYVSFSCSISLLCCSVCFFSFKLERNAYSHCC